MTPLHDVTEQKGVGSASQRDEARHDVLAHRLDDGYRRIDQAALAGANVTEWESFWIKLLGEYEDICRERDIAA